jgi:hypothetical protein
MANSHVSFGNSLVINRFNQNAVLASAPRPGILPRFVGMFCSPLPLPFGFFCSMAFAILTAGGPLFLCVLLIGPTDAITRALWVGFSLIPPSEPFLLNILGHPRMLVSPHAFAAPVFIAASVTRIGRKLT